MITLPSEIEKYYYEQKELIEFSKKYSSIGHTKFKVFTGENIDEWVQSSGRWVRKLISKRAKLDNDITIISFHYDTYREDDSPKVLVLGFWKRSDTNLVCGLNLNYFSSIEKQQLFNDLHEIMSDESTQDRVRHGRNLHPDFFEKYYRTYNEDGMDIVHIEHYSFDDDSWTYA